jgi:hypothetical protein
MVVSHHLFLPLACGSLARFMASASFSIFFIQRSTSSLFSALIFLHSLSRTSSWMLSVRLSSWTSLSRRFLPTSSSVRSRSLAARPLRSAASSRSFLSSPLVLVRSAASSASAARCLACSWPRDRSASARSSRSCAVAAVSEAAAVVVVVVALPGPVASSVMTDGGCCWTFCCNTAFSASRAATRSASWEPVRAKISYLSLEELFPFGWGSLIIRELTG